MDKLSRIAGEKKSLWRRIRDFALTDVGVLVRGLDEKSLERFEEVLLAADFGVPATVHLMERIEERMRAGQLKTEDDLRAALEAEIRAILEPRAEQAGLRFAEGGPTVILMVGVNGVGKTTTIGKLAHLLVQDGRSVLLAAGDTFRAGAIDQLAVWAERAGAEFVGAKPGGDPAAVAYAAIDAAETRGRDVVIVDTAGRLHTQDDLIVELAKVERVVARRLAGAPHETLLVLDATVGQNAVSQARVFGQALGLSGIVLAKLDSTARGGIVVALRQEFDLPVKFVGTGEQIGELRLFDPAEFARGVLLD